ncbi:histidinol-phosphatase HisJ family protein [Candidatus Saccharibacteria bacterium]|nr:histidinol-phosphatase HisJ family protein [Candidatus Saccharibacteria bacterium]
MLYSRCWKTTKGGDNIYKPKFIYNHIDQHVHTTISHDGKSTMKEYLEVAARKNVQEITFTEHYDIYDGVKTDLKTIEINPYWRAYKEATKDAPIKTHFGIEIGLRPECSTEIKSMTHVYDFDFIIGSSHITCGIDISKNNVFFKGKTMQNAYWAYFNDVRKNIDTYDDFDVYGHLDYIVRYGGYGCTEIKYSDYASVLDDILRTLVRKRKGLEINTSGFRYGLNYAHPTTAILQKYHDLGGRIITVGSDAHHVDQLAGNFKEAYRTLAKIGFTSIAVFEYRDPHFIEIKSLKSRAN